MKTHFLNSKCEVATPIDLEGEEKGNGEHLERQKNGWG
jgi:hypothetical protein